MLDYTIRFHCSQGVFLSQENDCVIVYDTQKSEIFKEFQEFFLQMFLINMFLVNRKIFLMCNYIIDTYRQIIDIYR